MQPAVDIVDVPAIVARNFLRECVPFDIFASSMIVYLS